MLDLTASDKARFWAKVARGEEEECWPWQAGMTGVNYGSFWLNGSAVSAPRVALAEKLGRPLSADEFACHKCDNPPCCNPAHLFAGSHADNMADMSAKGRSPARTGTHCVKGHELTGANLSIQREGEKRVRKRCLACQRLSFHKARARQQGVHNDIDPNDPKVILGGRNRTQCNRGHLLTPENVKLSRGRRVCRACQSLRDQAHTARRRSARLTGEVGR